MDLHSHAIFVDIVHLISAYDHWKFGDQSIDLGAVKA